MRGANITPKQREITPIQPYNYSNYSSGTPRFIGPRAKPHRQHFYTGVNYSNSFWNYSESFDNSSAFVGREEKPLTRRVIPAIEIYYYYVAGRSNINYSNPMGLENTKMEESIGVEGAGAFSEPLKKQA